MYSTRTLNFLLFSDLLNGYLNIITYIFYNNFKSILFKFFNFQLLQFKFLVHFYQMKR